MKMKESSPTFTILSLAASIKLLGKMVRCKINVLYHLLKKIGKEPNAGLFPFMKGASHQRTEEEIKFVFDHLGWSPWPATFRLYQDHYTNQKKLSYKVTNYQN